MKVLIDSSGWIEFFTDGPLASRYTGCLTSRHEVVTPTIVVYKVYKVSEARRLRYCLQAGSTGHK